MLTVLGKEGKKEKEKEKEKEKGRRKYLLTKSMVSKTSSQTTTTTKSPNPTILKTTMKLSINKQQTSKEAQLSKVLGRNRLLVSTGGTNPWRTGGAV